VTVPTVRFYPAIVQSPVNFTPAQVSAPDDEDASYWDLSYGGGGWQSATCQFVLSGVAPSQILSVTGGVRARGGSGRQLYVSIAASNQTFSPGAAYSNFTGPTASSGFGTDATGNATIGGYLEAMGTYGALLRVTTFWVDVTYEVPPNTPSLSGPSGTIWTMSPVFQGTYSHPDGEPLTAVQIELRRVSDDALIWNGTATSGLSQPNWSVAYGGPALTSGVQYRWRARVRDGGSIQLWSGWSSWLTFTPQQNTPPSVNQLSPANGANVGTLTPTLQWSYADADGHPQAAYQLQVQRASDSATMWDTGTVSSGASSAVYGGTALQVGVQYRWRIRVYDGYDWSAFTGWWTFTPALAPNPPTLTSPSGLIDTLTPQVQGAYNQGSGSAQLGYQYQIRSNGVTIYDSGQVNGAIGTGQQYGTNNPADTPPTPPALQWATAYEIRARSIDTNNQWSAWSAWTSFTTQSAPLTPTGLSPADGAVVNQSQPTLAWVHVDPDGDAQQAAEVAIQRVSDGVDLPGYPATLTQAGGSHQLTATLTRTPATLYRWRVRTRATPGPGFGPWSAWQQFTAATLPSVAVTNPAPGETVTAPNLAVAWSMSGGSGTQASFRVIVRCSGEAVHDSGVIHSAAATYMLPAGVLRNGLSYTVEILVTDTLGQQATSGQVVFTTQWTPPPAITGVTATAVGSQEVG
jgi:hypothetical protein